MTVPDLDVRRLCLEAPSLADARAALLNARTRAHGPISTALLEALKQEKARAVSREDQAMAKACWCLEQISIAQASFLEGFQAARGDDFYTFWCELATTETALHFLQPHYPLSLPEFGLRHLSLHVPRFQALFPYRVFFSMGFVAKGFECSVCGHLNSIRRRCGHIVGEIYDGEMCCRIPKEARGLELSVVEDPVYKPAVLFGPTISYEYGPVRYVVRALTSPWDGWICESNEIVEALERFPGTSNDAMCPCGLVKRYEDCCFTKPRKRIHYEFVSEMLPPPDMPQFTNSWSFVVKGNPHDSTVEVVADVAQ